MKGEKGAPAAGGRAIPGPPGLPGLPGWKGDPGVGSKVRSKVKLHVLYFTPGFRKVLKNHTKI